MFHKDTFRLIKKTFNRFFSLVMIVLIGVAFMMGLLSTRSIMEDNVDRYGDEYDLQDIQIYSSYGFDDADVEAIRSQSGVKNVFASRFADVYSTSSDGNVRVTRIEEIERDVDKFELIEGRLPEGYNEVVILDSGMTKGEYAIGETLTLSLDDKDIHDVLLTDRYVIVGIVKTPAYMSKTLGTGTLKNLDVEMVIYARNYNFKSEYYTTIYLTVDGSSEYGAFSSEYTDHIEEFKDDFEVFAKKQQEELKATLLSDYTTQIEDGEKELAEKKEEGLAKLEEAKQKLDDANIQIISGESQIQTLETVLNTALSRQKDLEKQYNKNAKTVNNKVAAIEKKDKQKRSFERIYAQLTADYATYSAMKRMLEDAGEAEYAENLKTQMAEIDAQYGGSVEKLYTEYSKLSRDKIYYDTLKEEINVVKKAENEARSEISRLKRQLAAGKKQYEQGLKDYQNGLAEFNAQIEKAELDIRKAYQELEELPGAQWMILDRGNHYSSVMYTNNAKQMGAIGIALPLLFFLVAALVCLTTMTRLVDEQRGQIGVFRALGFSKGQIVSKYVIYAMTATLTGSIAGIFVGMAIFPVVIYETWRLMYDLPEMIITFPMQYVVICFLAFSVLMSAVTAYVVNITLKEVPSQLMRPKAPKNARKVFLEKIGIIWKHLSFTGRITARNLIRYRSRALMTIIGVAGCTALLVVGWGIKDSIGDVVAIQFGQIYNYDYIVSMDGDTHVDELRAALEKDEFNEAVVPYMSYSSKVYLSGDEPTINVVVLDARDGNDMLNLHETDKKTDLKIRNSGVIITEKFAKNNGLRAGDTITIESASGIKQEVKINDICEMYFQHYLYISEDYYDTIFDEPVHYTELAVRNSEESAEEVAAYAKDTEGYESLTDFSSMADQFNTMIDALDFIILVIIITAGSLAFVVLINLTQVNISERIREIATLKVLGFHNSEVNTYIFKEILLLSLAGGIIGLPLGVVEHHFIMNIINMEMIMFGMNIKIPSFAMAFGITIVFTGIVLFFMRRPLRRVEMIESLKSVE